MAATTWTPDVDVLIKELKVVREKGINKLRKLDLPELTKAAEIVDAGYPPVEMMLRQIHEPTTGETHDAVGYAFGLIKGTEFWRSNVRRERTAEVFRRDTETIRGEDSYESEIMEFLANRIVAMVLKRQKTAETPAEETVDVINDQESVNNAVATDSQDDAPASSREAEHPIEGNSQELPVDASSINEPPESTSGDPAQRGGGARRKRQVRQWVIVGILVPLVVAFIMITPWAIDRIWPPTGSSDKDSAATSKQEDAASSGDPLASGSSGTEEQGCTRQTYDTNNRPSFVVLNSISNNSKFGNECSFVQAKEVGTDNSWANVLDVHEGREYEIRLLVFNDASLDRKLVAKDVNAMLNLPVETSRVIRVSGFLDTSNSAEASIWDEVALQADQPFNLFYIKGSLRFHNDFYGWDNGVLLSEDFFTNAGVSLGYDALNGDLPNGDAFGGFISFRVKPQFAPNANFEITEMVRHSTPERGKWSGVIDATPGTLIDYQIRYENTGDIQNDNVSISALLPAGLEYQSGSTMILNSNNPDGAHLADGVTSTDGINIGHYLPGAVGYVKFTVMVTENVDLPLCGSNKVVTSVSASTDYGVRKDGALVVVQKQC